MTGTPRISVVSHGDIGYTRNYLYSSSTFIVKRQKSIFHYNCILLWTGYRLCLSSHSIFVLKYGDRKIYAARARQEGLHLQTTFQEGYAKAPRVLSHYSTQLSSMPFSKKTWLDTTKFSLSKQTKPRDLNRHASIRLNCKFRQYRTLVLCEFRGRRIPQ